MVGSPSTPTCPLPGRSLDPAPASPWGYPAFILQRSLLRTSPAAGFLGSREAGQGHHGPQATLRMYLLPWTNYSHVHIASHYCCLLSWSPVSRTGQTREWAYPERAVACVYGLIVSLPSHCVGRKQRGQAAACPGHTVVSTFGIQMSYQGCEFGGAYLCHWGFVPRWLPWSPILWHTRG